MLLGEWQRILLLSLIHFHVVRLLVKGTVRCVYLGNPHVYYGLLSIIVLLQKAEKLSKGNGSYRKGRDVSMAKGDEEIIAVSKLAITGIIIINDYIWSCR